MPRASRIHIRGGLYYLTQFPSGGQTLFSDGADIEMLEVILARALARTGTHALAYCWLPDAFHLVTRCMAIPISRFMQGFTSSYARRIHACRRESGHLFVYRFQSTLLDPAWLPETVRFIHYAPVLAGLSSRAADYPHSSHATYAHAGEPAWLQTQALFRTLRQRGLSRAATLRFLSCTPSEQEIALLAPQRRCDARILGSDEFLKSLPRNVTPRRSHMDLDRLSELVAHSQGVSRGDLFSASRERHLSLCRALLAWHAVERRVASLSAVAHLLHRDTSTLSKAITRYRSRKPELFRLDALHRFWPIA